MTDEQLIPIPNDSPKMKDLMMLPFCLCFSCSMEAWAVTTHTGQISRLSK
jgi:hypothetical protein